MPEKRDESFSRKYRLCKSRDFKRVFSKGKRTASRFFVIYFLPSHLLFPRLGIQVKAKIGSATRRNYIKRIVREAFRRMKYEFQEPGDLIFIAEKGMSELDYHQFEKEFRKVLKKYLQ